jgi:hypothetical protein
MATVTFKVNPTTAQWGYDEETYPSGTLHSVDVDADSDFAAVLAAADAAGAIEIQEGVDELPNTHIETDDESLEFRAQVDELRASVQGERDEFVRQFERELAVRGEHDAEFTTDIYARELQARVNDLDRDLHGTDIDELKGYDTTDQPVQTDEEQ